MTSCLESSGANAPEGFEAVDASHADVHQDQVGLHFGNQLEALFAGGGGGQLNFRRIKNALKGVLNVRFVIN